MNSKFLPALFIFIFSIQSLQAQDSVKHKAKHNHSSKVSSASNSDTKDEVKAKTPKPVVMPKYQRDGYVALSAGLGAPVGGYSGSGSAGSGSVFSISAGFPGIISHCGIGLKFDDGTNSINQGNFLNSLSNGLGFSNISYSFVGKVNAYSYKTLLTGIYLTYPGKTITIDARILGGVMFANVPSIAINMTDNTTGNMGAFYQGETSASGFAIDFGLDARYWVNRKFSVIFSADYLHADPSFLLVVTGAALNTNGEIAQEAGRETTASSQPFSLFSLSLGIGYNIMAQKPSSPQAQ